MSCGSGLVASAGLAELPVPGLSQAIASAVCIRDLALMEHGVIFGHPTIGSSSSAPMLHAMLLASIFVAICAVTDILYVLAAGLVLRHVAQGSGLGRIGRVVGGSTFIGLGVFPALTRTATER